jgi:2-keto-4-pentenoate hydratase/2-oxohepta-3-ene-1,7-dioic acid hydratase in catechol pathway
MPHTVRIYRERIDPSNEARARLVLEVDGRWLDLSQRCSDEGDEHVAVAALLADGYFERARLERELGRGTWRETSPVTERLVPIEPERVGKILALGKNFREHAAEFGEAAPEEPLVFNKLPETLRADGATVSVPSWYTARFDHEVELAVVIGKSGRSIDEARAMEHVAGYTIANDLTARTLQGQDRSLKYPWFRSKNFEGSCPLGPCLAPRDFLDISDLRVTARVLHAGGVEEPRQDATTKDFIVTVPQAIAWLSRQFTLRPGDLLIMGTPAGVGPLVNGDTSICAIAGLGELRTPIARA